MLNPPEKDKNEYAVKYLEVKGFARNPKHLKHDSTHFYFTFFGTDLFDLVVVEI